MTGVITDQPKRKGGYEALLMAVYGLTVTSILLLVAVIWLRDAVRDAKDEIHTVRTEQVDGIERGYKNRAASCRIPVLLGAENGPECLEPGVLKYFNPSEKPTAGSNSPGQVTNRQALCVIIRMLGGTPEQAPILKDSACT